MIVNDRDLHRVVSHAKTVLRRFGLLPITDAKGPSLVSIAAGAPIFGSWWGHPAGQLIYQVGEALESDPDVLVVRLWRGKLTLVDRRLWPAIVRIGTARSHWQIAGLSGVAFHLLAYIEQSGIVRGDGLPPNVPIGSEGFRSALRELDQRLLILTRSVHTSTGSHALEAESWRGWAARTRCLRLSGSVASAQLAIEEAARRLSPGVDPRQCLPWPQSPAKPRPQRASHDAGGETRFPKGDKRLT
jgi:hypothetical protein